MTSKYDPDKSRAYYRTVKGLLRRIYNNQKMTSKKMGRNPPTYSYEELHDWVTSQPNFQKLYDAWVNSDYKKELIPSIDRKDNYQSYTLSNIQLITFQENLKNQKNQNISEECLHTKSKGVRQLSLDGVVLQEFGSIANAMRAVVGERKSVSNISNVCNGKWPTAYGYRWEWV